MLTEEVLILLATLGASGLLVLGIVEFLWPARPRETRRRVPDVTAEFDTPGSEVSPRPGQTAGLADSTVAATPVPDTATAKPATGLSEPFQHKKPPTATESSVTLSIARSETGSLFAEHVDETGSTPLPPEDTRSPDTPRSAASEARTPVLPIGRCLALYNDRNFSEVVTLASAALELHAGLAPMSGRSDEAVALLDLVGLAKQELGDREGARSAFLSAIRDAEPRLRPKYVRHLVALVRGVAEIASPPGGDDLAQLRELRACMASLDHALTIVPGDAGVRAAQGMVRDALAPACERLVARVVSGEDGEHGRELVLETLSDDAMPTAWQEHLRDQLTSVSSAEIGQLTAQAIRSVQEGRDIDALEALERAERLSEGLPSAAVTEERREEFERRLWWGYTKVGLRRIDMGEFESALEPLFRALRLGGIDEDRLLETRGALSRALEGLVDDTARRIQKLEPANVRAAQAELERLAALLRNSTERGVPADDLGDAFAKFTDLEQRLAESRA